MRLDSSPVRGTTGLRLQAGRRQGLFDQFYQIYWSKNNNPTAIELKLFEMAEDHLVQLHVALAHQYPGFTYTVGWAAMNRAYVEIMDEDTKLKEKLVLHGTGGQARAEQDE